MPERLTNNEIYNIWRHGVCKCTAKKYERECFCYGCFSELSPEARQGLGGSKFTIKLQVAYRKAWAELEGLEQEEL
jgi:hypothetical protein